MGFTSAKLAAVSAIACMTVSATPVARAEAPASADRPHTEEAAARPIDKTWLYLDDARVADPGAVIAMASVAYTSVASNPDPTSEPYRAFAANTAQAGGLTALGAEVGVLPRISFEALGQVQLRGDGPGVNPGALAGARFDLSPPSWRAVHLVASGGYLRETSSTPAADEHASPSAAPGGADGAWASLAVAWDLERLRFGVTTLGEHVFAAGRDGVDIMVQAGVSYRVASWLRAGAEWVGQDLEESLSGAAEGGARHFVGPTAAVRLLHDRLTIVAGPSLGLSTGSPTVLGRLAVAYGF